MNAQKLGSSFANDLSQVRTLEQLEALHTTYLGRKGHINNLLKSIGSLPSDTRKKIGNEINVVKRRIESDIESKRKSVLTTKTTAETYDPTLPGTHIPSGSLHLVTYAIDEISSIFKSLGFIRQSYPEIEWEYFSFESLNMPPDHPARDDFETFFVDETAHPEMGRMLLTPHTSSGQNREMTRVKKPPIKMINISKTYRRNWDSTHVPMFHQFEGLCVDRSINITNLKGTIEYFVHNFFGSSREVRLRPFHFQFTEPSFEVDITCDLCGGTGVVNKSRCRVCKSGWLELGGAGMVHPKVLTSGGIDPKKFSGWAFGFGIERVMMMKEGLKVDDLRILYDGDVRFLQQF